MNRGCQFGLLVRQSQHMCCDSCDVVVSLPRKSHQWSNTSSATVISQRSFSREGGSQMVGSWLGNRSNRTQRADRVAAVPMPARAGVLSCPVLDPVNQPVPHAEFVVTDTAGRKVVGGGLDPFGSFAGDGAGGRVPARGVGRGVRPVPGEGHGGGERAGLARRSDAARRPAARAAPAGGLGDRADALHHRVHRQAHRAGQGAWQVQHVRRGDTAGRACRAVGHACGDRRVVLSTPT